MYLAPALITDKFCWRSIRVLSLTYLKILISNPRHDNNPIFSRSSVLHPPSYSPHPHPKQPILQNRTDKSQLITEHEKCRLPQINEQHLIFIFNIRHFYLLTQLLTYSLGQLVTWECPHLISLVCRFTDFADIAGNAILDSFMGYLVNTALFV